MIPSPSPTRRRLTRSFKVFALIALLPGAALAQADPDSAGTPSGDKPEPGAETRIACRYEGDASFEDAPLPDKPATGTFHYLLYLPEGYSDAKEHPVIFVMSPGGRARTNPLRRFADAEGWIIVALQEAKNGPWAPIMGNFLAAHEDVMRRCAADPERKYATGFSGGARGSSLFAQLRPGFRGLILQGAGFFYHEGEYGVRQLPADCRVAMLMGNQDDNHGEIARLRESLPDGQPFRVWEFDGGHGRPPRPLLDEALRWIAGES